MIRKDCFWHIERNGHINTPPYYTYHECHLSEDGDCPCTEDCKWYINETEGLNKAYAKLYEDMLKE